MEGILVLAAVLTSHGLSLHLPQAVLLKLCWFSLEPWFSKGVFETEMPRVEIGSVIRMSA